MLKSIFINENILDDINIRFIVPSKNICNLGFELLKLLSNLHYISITFFEVGLQFKYCNILYNFFKDFIQCLINEKGYISDVIPNILNKFYEKNN